MKPPRKIWQVWVEQPGNGEKDITKFSGSRTKARQYFDKHGGYKAGLHFGYTYEQTDEARED